ncbi:MAG TPA: hypothetical protein VKZ18_04090 [Polyangia bacterium]|nr:hypothetical protein [Polyangia bacterium]
MGAPTYQQLERTQLEGMEVFDVDGTKVGKVVRVDKVLGYFETLGAFTGPRYIPFFAIERIDPPGIRLNVMKSVVTQVYDHTPGARPDLTPDGKLTGGTVASGYTGRAVPLDADALRAAREDLFVGATVLDADGKNLGTIQAFDGRTGYMRIEKDGFTVKDLFLPVTSVSFVDDRGIHLSESKEILRSRYCRMPGVAHGFYGS